MNRLRRWSVVLTVLLAVGFGWADDKSAPKTAGEQKWLTDRSMTVTPQPEPRPALKYRLLPLVNELAAGNAVPVYLRMGHELYDARRKEISETPTKWNNLPLDQVPLGEARKFLDDVRGMLSQFDFGARRRSAEWDYTLEQPDPISILLPDVQQMRVYTPMLVLRARVKVAEGDFVGAARAFETGFAVSRQVAEGPFLIHGLVGIAIANQFVNRIPEWIERPDSPNLYWSLTTLPRPMIDLRREFEFEQTVMPKQFTDLADLDRPRSAAEWDSALKRFRAEVRRVDRLANGEGSSDAAKLPPAPDPDEPAAKSAALPAARRFVAERSGKSSAEVNAMPPAQILLLYAAGTYADLRDDVFKNTYLPFPQAHAREPRLVQRMNEITDRLREAPAEEGLRLARMFLPAVTKALGAQARLDRNIAMLRVIEALRLHAAANGGQLPDSLDQVTIVPVPLDPGTGKQFEYHRDGATASLVSRISGVPEVNGLRYRVTVRGK